MFSMMHVVVVVRKQKNEKLGFKKGEICIRNVVTDCICIYVHVGKNLFRSKCTTTPAAMMYKIIDRSVEYRD